MNNLLLFSSVYCVLYYTVSTAICNSANKYKKAATASTEKTSGIQKLMGLAYTLKNPDNGLGDLRQKKDEILALNFLTTKEDKTNKEKN